jgi:hypothetical protein
MLCRNISFVYSENRHTPMVNIATLLAKCRAIEFCVACSYLSILGHSLGFFWGSWVWNGVHSDSWSDKLSSYLNKEVTVRFGKLKMQLWDSICWPHVNPVQSGAVGKDCQRRLISRSRFVRACRDTDILYLSVCVIYVSGSVGSNEYWPFTHMNLFNHTYIVGNLHGCHQCEASSVHHNKINSTCEHESRNVFFSSCNSFPDRRTSVASFRASNNAVQLWELRTRWPGPQWLARQQHRHRHCGL